jgi:hypothetical protein
VHRPQVSLHRLWSTRGPCGPGSSRFAPGRRILARSLLWRVLRPECGVFSILNRHGMPCRSVRKPLLYRLAWCNATDRMPPERAPAAITRPRWRPPAPSFTSPARTAWRRRKVRPAPSIPKYGSPTASECIVQKCNFCLAAPAPCSVQRTSGTSFDMTRPERPGTSQAARLRPMPQYWQPSCPRRPWHQARTFAKPAFDAPLSFRLSQRLSLTRVHARSKASSAQPLRAPSRL